MPDLHQSPHTTETLPAPIDPWRVFIKAIILFLIFNLAFAACYPLDWLGKITIYNHWVPGRSRLPYGDNPQASYNLSLFNLPAMFASHELAGKSRTHDEFRVVLVGDSSTWGFLLPPEKTVSALINEQDLSLPDGRKIHAYNLGYPVMSLLKDVLILSLALDYQPDLIIWPVTLESFPGDKQLFPPLLQNNPTQVRRLLQKSGLSLNPESGALIDQTFWQRTLVGSRKSLADMVRLQLYGLMWAATGIDQELPESYTPRMEDLSDDRSFHNLEPPHLTSAALAMDVLAAGIATAGDTPVLLVNEPMFISQGANSQIRYNFYYPRWAYDDYRVILSEFCRVNHIPYLDLWDAIPAGEFTNSAVHLTPGGNLEYSRILAQAIRDLALSGISE